MKTKDIINLLNTYLQDKERLKYVTIKSMSVTDPECSYNIKLPIHNREYCYYHLIAVDKLTNGLYAPTLMLQAGQPIPTCIKDNNDVDEFDKLFKNFRDIVKRIDTEKWLGIS